MVSCCEGVIDNNEFYEIGLSMHTAMPETGEWTRERSDDAFEILDEDGSSSIDLEEFIGFYMVRN